jgi:hypothetical protein
LRLEAWVWRLKAQGGRQQAGSSSLKAVVRDGKLRIYALITTTII